MRARRRWSHVLPPLAGNGYADVLHQVQRAPVLNQPPPELKVLNKPGKPFVPEICDEGQETNHTVYMPRLLDHPTTKAIQACITSFLEPCDHTTGRRRSIVRWPALSAALWSRISSMWPDSVELHGEEWVPIGIGAGWTCVGYENGGFHAPHTDECTVLDINTKSLQSLLIYAAEPHVEYSGGEFVFTEDLTDTGCSNEVTFMPPLLPPVGSVIGLSHIAPHEARAVTAGQKWILRSDVIIRRKIPVVDTESISAYHRARVLRTQGRYGEADAAETEAYELSPRLHSMRFGYDPTSRRDFVDSLS